MEAARRIFDRCLARAGGRDRPWPIEASWSEVAGRAEDLFPTLARACDLNVAGGPADRRSSTLDDAISTVALLSSGRLTLLVPSPPHLEGDVLRHVMIAWDDSPAAARTIAQAMPLIAAASMVSLFIAETAPERVTPCNAILGYLRAAGVTPVVTRAVPLVRTIRETLARHAEESGASLVVMGAYNHSRLHEMLLGGTTRRLIAQARCAVLMAG